MDEIRPITGWFTKNISKLSSLLMGTRGPPRGECVLPQLLPLCNKPCLEVLDQFSICCFIVHFARLIEEASAILRRLEFHFGSHFIHFSWFRYMKYEYLNNINNSFVQETFLHTSFSRGGRLETKPSNISSKDSLLLLLYIDILKSLK